MLRSPAPSEVLARWHYTPDEWRDFTEHERETKGFEIGDALTKHFNVIMVTAALIMVVFGIAGGAGGVAGAAIIAAVVGGFFLVIAGLHRAVQMYAQNRLEASAGEVLITHDGVCTNGMWFGWGREK